VSLATELAAQFAASHGVQTPFELEVVKAHAHMHAERVPKLPNRFWRLVGGRGFMVGEADQQRMLTSIVGRGHSVEAISLYCHQSKALYAGDMLCPDTITALRLAPDEPEADAVHLLLDSLELLRDLPAGVSLYSAHGLRAMALGDRVAEMQTHYADQLALVLRACAGGAITAYELTQQWAPQSLGQAVRPPLPDALSLTVAYLNALWHARLVERENRAGIWWFWAHK
jgi:glyoxylase-like metal-dependent hydrolase (beta-lactamase superfamily II)